MIKAIETLYKGYRFRSRLEARWAVFFDALDVSWRYETEGFYLGDGLNYLPDFWIDDLRSWVEIKPPGEVTEEEREKARRLAIGTGQPVWILYGDVWPGAYEAVSYQGRLLDHLTPRKWALVFENTLAVFGVMNRLGIHTISDDMPEQQIDAFGRALDRDLPMKMLEAAYKAARQARFEHGESPWTESLKRSASTIAVPG